ncbi:MAG TPA: folylpolyglutamate synthase/dihydrofolate synthase family protein [Symbiobacteriaceae bacterium]|jgi:dihydrofolate synthase/folylpolyglutamate synthase|nr:folylpolyglutamate synthase/dihydrofolate synthase family protein [Symbiobacteriaceae bacterium]
MRYEEAMAYVYGLQRVGVKLGLERTQELLRRLGNPERKCGRIVHVTGTSGKGSVSAMVEAGLRAAGQKVGLYTSPSLERFTERFQVNRQDIAPDELADLITELRGHVEQMAAEGGEPVTEFEFTTALGFLHFARQRVDWLVLEVGVGGRYDATNVVGNTAVACITNIGLDHVEWLGDTEEKIAWEKAGIIKPAVPCVTGTEHPGALQVIREVALANDAVLTEVTSEDYRVVSYGPEGQVVDLYGARGWYEGVRLPLLGNHQAANAAVALRVLELCGVGEEAVRQGLGAVTWPGRLEVLALPGGPMVLLDAAHNPPKCEALAAAVRQYFPGRPVRLVLGALADKDVAAMARPLVEMAEQVWVTTPESPRKLPAADLAEVCRRFGRDAVVEPSIGAAVGLALEGARPGDLVLVTGSFYTVGPARQFVHARIGQEA